MKIIVESNQIIDICGNLVELPITPKVAYIVETENPFRYNVIDNNGGRTSLRKELCTLIND